MFVLFIFHHLLNRNWYSNLFRGKYTPLRILQTAADVLLLAAMIGLMVSGIILSSDGYILTNAHVISGAANLVVVLDNNEEYAAQLIGSDISTDLAVIKIDAENNLIAIKGAVPGPKGAVVCISDSVKA